MTGWLKNMWTKHNTNGFAKNKQNINKKWPPKKWISLFIQQCEDDNIEPASKRDIEATYMSLINMESGTLKNVSQDHKQPVIVRKLASFIIDTKDINVIEKIVDRGVGKAEQKVLVEKVDTIKEEELED